MSIFYSTQPASTTSHDITSHANSSSEVQIVSIKKIRKSVANSLDVKPGEYGIVSFGTSLYTSGVACCIAIIAKIYFNDKLTQVSVAHYDGIEPDLLEFFGEIAKDKTSKVALYVFGGYEDQQSSTHMQDLEKAKESFKNINIENARINPWKMDPRYLTMEKELDSFDMCELSLTAGITKSGEIQVADDRKISLCEGEDFIRFEQVLQEMLKRAL